MEELGIKLGLDLKSNTELLHKLCRNERIVWKNDQISYRVTFNVTVR